MYSRQQLSEIVSGDDDGFAVVCSTVVDESRWARGVDTVVEDHNGKLFIINWRKGATEYQDHEYPNQPVPAEAYAVTEIKYRALQAPESITRAPKVKSAL